MRVALIHPHILEDLSGIGIDTEAYSCHVGYEHRYARLLERDGYEVDLVVFSRSYNVVRWMRHMWGHHIVIVPIGRVRFLRYFQLFKRLLGLVAGYDLVHCFSYYSNIYDILAVCCWLAGAPLVAQSQGIWPNIPFIPYLRKMFTLRLASRLVPLSRSEAGFLMGKFRISGRRIIIVPNFIESGDYRVLSRLEARRMLGLDEDSFVVLTVCRLVPEKGVQTLLEATAIIKNIIPKLSVVVVGEGPYRKKLEGFARSLGLEGVVRFEGYVPNQDIGKYYSAANCFVLASFEESFGIALLEAMLFSLPVIASATWGAKDIIGGDGVGLMISPGDHIALSELIMYLHANPDKVTEIGKKGRERALKAYSAENVRDRLSKVYMEVVGK